MEYSAARGAATRVVTDPAFEFSRTDPSVQVLVLDAETRHLTPEKAGDVIRRAVSRALAAGIPYIYKKTDSALRGNVGAELAAVLEAAGADRIPFIPAFPKTGRTTKNGIHLIDGTPVAESVFGQDPFEPVRYSRVADILGEQTSLPVIEQHIGDPEGNLPGIQVFDASTDDDLFRIGWQLGPDGVRLSAGCAGFAEVLAGLLALSGPKPQLPLLRAPFFVVCGSVNPVTLRQLDAAEQNGFPRFQLLPEQKLLPAWLSSDDCTAAAETWLKTARQAGRCILDSNDPPDHRDAARRFAAEHGMDMDQVRVGISTTLGHLMKRLLDGGRRGADQVCVPGETL